MEALKLLIVRAQAGDMDAYGTIVQRFQDMAVGYAYSILGDFHLAEDAAQEAFMEAYANLSKVYGETAFPSWLRKIIFKHCDRLTRGKRISTVPIEAAVEMASPEKGPAEIAEAQEMKDAVLQAIAVLPEKERMVTTLFYINGYSQKDIGEFLDVAVKTVKNQLHSARNRLRERMIPMVRETLYQQAPSRDDEFITKIERDVAELQQRYSEGDVEARRKIVVPLQASFWMQNRFENIDLASGTLAEDDARVLVAKKHGFGNWVQMESDLHLDPLVREVIEAIGDNDTDRVKDVLSRNPSVADPNWRSGYKPPNATDAISWVNEAMPLFHVSKAVFEGKIPPGTNEYTMSKALLDAGADADFFGGYPLAAAVSFNATQVVRALLESGASVNGADDDGVPMAYALFFGFTTVSALLAEWGAKLDLRFAAGIGDLDKVKSFFKADGSLKPGAGALADPYGHEWKQHNGTVHRCDRTRENILSQALLYACLHGSLEAAEHLIQQGADVNALVPDLGEGELTILHRLTNTGNFGATADPKAVEHQRLGAVNFLLEHGADVTIRDPGHKTTPLQWAKHFGCECTAEILQKHGATK